MNKRILLPALLALAALLASLFGLLCEQLAYALSPEYFLKYRFLQGNFAGPYGTWAQAHPRLGAAWLGIRAVWWLGLLICLPLEALLRHKLRRSALIWNHSLRALGIIFGLAALAALLGLVLADALTWHADVAYYPRLLRQGIEHPQNFVLVLWMHRGALVGLVLSFVLVFAHSLRLPAALSE